jgi:hypothetical protein
MKLLEMPVEVVREIASRIKDSTSRIRFNAVVPHEYRVRKDHDSRLSMLEYIVRSTGRLRLMSADTLRFLLEHGSPLAEPFRGSEHEKLLRFEDDVKSGVLGDVPASISALEVSRVLGEFATPEYFDAFMESVVAASVYPELKSYNSSTFVYAMKHANNGALLRHVSSMEWFKTFNPSSYTREFFLENLGASMAEWSSLLEDRAVSGYGYESVYKRVKAGV